MPTHRTRSLAVATMATLVLVACSQQAAPNPEVLSAHAAKGDTSAIGQLITLAESNDPRAQHRLATLFLEGQGVERNQDKALQWYEKAATAGHAGAQANMAVMYWRGFGVEADIQRAREYALASATQGNADGLMLLGGMIFDGAGGERNRPLGYALINQADPKQFRIHAKVGEQQLGAIERMLTTGQLSHARAFERELQNGGDLTMLVQQHAG